MAETFYRIKNAKGEYWGDEEDGQSGYWVPSAVHAHPYTTEAEASELVKSLSVTWAGVRVVKTTLKQSKCLGKWDGGYRFNDFGTPAVRVYMDEAGAWRWSRRLRRGKWRASKYALATEAIARVGADTWLRKRGRRLS